MKTTIDGVFVEVSGGEMEEAEIREYVKYLRENKRGDLEYVKITIDGDYVELRYKYSPQKFQRIRRITGYLSGVLDTWNNAKRAEEKDRVKHI